MCERYLTLPTITDESESIAGSIHFVTDWHGKRFLEIHTIMRQGVHFGGYRYFLQCGVCFRRVKALYFSTRTSYVQWSCRICAGLVYASSREHRSIEGIGYAAQRAQERASELRSLGHPRLGARLEQKAQCLYLANRKAAMDYLRRHAGPEILDAASGLFTVNLQPHGKG